MAISSSSTPKWNHTPSNITLLWILFSVPLVIWDTAYLFLRPHSMEGGFLQWPLWVPYGLYGTVDYMYGWPAFNSQDGFPQAQGLLNLVESGMYIWYLWIVRRNYGQGEGYKRGMGRRVVQGNQAAKAVLVAHAAAVMTFSKTALYGLQEYYSGFHFIRHNSFWRLFWLYIIPNGLWLVFPCYMIIVFTREILDGLDLASSTTGSSSSSSSSNTGIQQRRGNDDDKDD